MRAAAIFFTCAVMLAGNLRLGGIEQPASAHAASHAAQAGHVCATGDGWHGRLARHWAPAIFQDIDVSTDNPSGRYDFITAADFDGDQAAGNNWENSDDSARGAFPLVPYVYYAIVETQTHYYITYSLFHPRDWSRSITAAAAALTHENDLESATLVILKDRGFGRLRLVGTVCHLSNYCFPASSDVVPEVWAVDTGSGPIAAEFYDGHPCLFVESGGHGIGGVERALRATSAGPYRFEGRNYEFRGPVGVVYTCTADPAFVPGAEPVAAAGPSALAVGDGGGEGDEGGAAIGCSYQLVPLAASLWPLRERTGAGEMFEDTFNYRSRLGCSVSGLPAYFAADGQDKGANPPWARVASTDGLARGVWFLDPAYAWDRYTKTWKDAELPGYWQYVRNDYMTGDIRIDVVSPGADRTWPTGFPMKIAWQVGPEASRLTDGFGIYLSRNGGKTWLPLAVGASVVSPYTWTVTGPPGEECMVAVRAALACDGSITTVGFSDTVKLAGTRPFEWSALTADSAPPARSLAQAIYDPAEDRLIIFAGEADESSTRYNDIWALGFGDMLWEELDGGSRAAPPKRSSHIAVYDPERRGLVVSGGRGDSLLGDTWLYSLQRREWTELATSGGRPRAGSVGIYDPIGGRLIVFGGWDGTRFTNEVLALGLAGDGNHEWTALESGPEPAPRARAYAAGAYDGACRRIIVHGGLAGEGAIQVACADTWAFSLETYRWELLHDGAAGCPHSRWLHSGVVDLEGTGFVIFGGRDGGTAYEDTWVLDLERREWSRPAESLNGPGPGARQGACAVLRRPGGQVVLAAGSCRETPTNDVWTMDLVRHPPVASQDAQVLDGVPVAGRGIWPNPSGGSVTIAFSTREQGRVKVAIYDSAGRLVRVLRDSSGGPGTNIVEWDGRDSSLANVAAGVYFCRIVTAGFVLTEPVVIAR